MAKHTQQPDRTTPYTGTASPRISFSHPIAISVAQKQETHHREVSHVLHDLKKTGFMIGLLVIGEIMLYILLTKHIMIIPTVNY